MGLLIEVLDVAAKVTPVVLVSGGLLAFVLREKIKQVLSKSLLFDVEQKKADLQREIEAYKVSLIGEVERVKAAQEVKKALALRIGEKRFVALASMLDAHLGLATDVGGFVTTRHLGTPVATEYLSRRRDALLERFDRYTRAYDAAALFMSNEMRRAILGFQQAAHTVYELRPPGNDLQPLPAGHAAIREMLREAVAVENLLSSVISDMERLGEQLSEREGASS